MTTLDLEFLSAERFADRTAISALLENGAALERLGATPAGVAAYMRMNSQIDISDVLPTIRVPTLVVHRTGDVTINIEGGRYLAEHIPGARLLDFLGTTMRRCEETTLTR